MVSGGSSWEKARHCTQADPTIPLSLRSQTNTRQPNRSICDIRSDSSTFPVILQVFFAIFPERKPNRIAETKRPTEYPHKFLFTEHYEMWYDT